MHGMPTVLNEHKKLLALAGKWTGEEKIHPSPWDPKGGTATSRIESRADLDGFFVISDYVEERNGQVSYRGHGVFGYDANEKCYTMNWFDSMGACSPEHSRGKWEGNTLMFQQKGPMGHSRYTYLFEGEGRYTFRIDQSQDGKQWAPFMEGRYTRR